VKAENSEDLDRKCWSLHDKEPYPNRGETTSRTHMQLGESSRRHEKRQEENRGRTGPKWAQAGPTHFDVGSTPPLT
jgi:hypothetical protein